jgi:hypothetical protein
VPTIVVNADRGRQELRRRTLLPLRADGRHRWIVFKRLDCLLTPHREEYERKLIVVLDDSHVASSTIQYAALCLRVWSRPDPSCGGGLACHTGGGPHGHDDPGP